jgi:3-alpha-(or 20-beta)-hydroxysteroid dehydrogenase
MNFSGKTAIVTGAASGMALLFCKKFADLGGNVVMTDINGDILTEKAAEINAENPGKALAAVCDVRKYEEVCAVRDLAVKTYGSIDVMVNLAGGAETRILHASGEFPDIPIEVYDWGIDVNLKGQFYFDHAVMKQMREQKSGVIINIGSITGEEGCAANVAYSTSKSGAMNGLTKSLALYGSKYGIRCVCVSPGPVLTRPGMAAMKTALGRAAEPEELVNMLLYAASDEGSFLDGVNILMDGGRNIMRNKD